MKVLVRGPALTRTGYGEHCRFVLRSLRQVEGLDITYYQLIGVVSLGLGRQ